MGSGSREADSGIGKSASKQAGGAASFQVAQMAKLEYNTAGDIQQAHKTIVETFLTGKTRPIAWRKEQLLQLGLLVQENEKAIAAALESDLGRHEYESIMVEINPIKFEVEEAISHLDAWSKPKSVKTTLAWKMSKATIYYEPKGAVLVIGTWNYPLTLTLGPMVGAIAAGNTAILKPAEQAPALAALLATLFPRYLDSAAFHVINGAVEQTTELLKLRFDHIFYTGSGNIGKIIAKAAAEHLTPVTLELGGKSPAVIFEDANMAVTMRRILFGKWINAAQTCIAPDYILCTKAMQPKVISAFKSAMAEFTQPTAGNATQAGNMLNNRGFAKIVNENHFNRVKKLLDTTKGSVVYGGNTNSETGKIEVTLVADVTEDDALMQGEIFGPVLPIVTVNNMNEAVDFIQKRDNPLALYVFTQKTSNRDFIFERTRSGGFLHNDVLVHFAIPGLPFGGAGPSGYGNYHGKHSFLCFSHERAAASIPTWMDFALAARYPPYTASKVKQLLMLTGVTIKKKRSILSLPGLLRLALMLFVARAVGQRLLK